MVQRVLVTAGASGIGREIARAFAAGGAKVFVCDIDEAALDALAKELPGIATTRCDVSKRTEIARMVPAALQSLGGLDVLVNNAGIAGPTVPIEEVPPEEWDRVVEVNLTAAFDVTRLSIPALKQSAAGVVIVMSSAAGRFGYANRVAYAATKWGLIGFTKTLAVELGRFGIRANAILPGTVEGDRIQRVFEGRAKLSGRSVDEVREASMQNQSIRALVDPRDIAALAVFLASDAGKSISGQALSIDNDIQRL
ncbi:MAG: SDR family oxidoreductase [Burkholderiaceae bacterium]|nr:SDR family oxidoreductase [Burkholderiaceae bacterium]